MALIIERFITLRKNKIIPQGLLEKAVAAYQKQGIGSEIVQRILNHPRLKKVELFWLCTRQPGFYERLGFSSKEQTGMVWNRSQNARLE